MLIVQMSDDRVKSAVLYLRIKDYQKYGTWWNLLLSNMSVYALKL